MRAPQPRSRSIAATAGGKGIVLAIDYGRRRLGLAISDELGWAAAPLATIERRGRSQDVSRLRALATCHRVVRIIVGHPLRMDGTAGGIALEAARFAERLKEALGMPVELVDERLTSWAAARWRAEFPRRARRRSQDEVAAAIFLEDYLADGRRSNG